MEDKIKDGLASKCTLMILTDEVDRFYCRGGNLP